MIDARCKRHALYERVEFVNLSREFPARSLENGIHDCMRLAQYMEVNSVYIYIYLKIFSP